MSVWHHGEGDFKQFFSFTIPGVEKEYPAGVFLGDKDPKTSKYKIARILAEDGRDLSKAIAECCRSDPRASGFCYTY